MGILHSFDLTTWQWLSIIASSALLGFSKTGLSSAMILAVPVLAAVFGGKDSTGIILPMLIVGDIFAIAYYSRHAEWHEIKNLMPWNLAGLILGVVVGNRINDSQFKALIAVSVLICLGILIYTEIRGADLKVPRSTTLYVFLGVLCGFTSMIGNAAGPIFSVYLLAKGFKKYDFMGTTAWFFLINNLMKVPLQIFVWHNISTQTLILAICMIPAITVGALLGVKVLRIINDKHFRWVIIGMTAIASFKLFL